MVAEKETLLDRLVRRSFPINLLYEAKNNAYSRPIAELILASHSVAERAEDEWLYKSLAEFGEEKFITSGNIYLYEGRDWSAAAIDAFSECVYRNVWYEENEGLIFYVQENGKYRPARNGDPEYDFVCRLREDGSLSDLRFTSAPKWARELYIFRPNYQAYCLMWHDCSNTGETYYQQSKKLKAEAVIRETARLAGDIALMEGTDVEGSDESTDDTPMTAKERNTLLIIIEALCRYTDIKSQERGTAPKIASLTHAAGAPVGDDTVRDVLKQIPKALETRMK